MINDYTVLTLLVALVPDDDVRALLLDVPPRTIWGNPRGYRVGKTHKPDKPFISFGYKIGGAWGQSSAVYWVPSTDDYLFYLGGFRLVEFGRFNRALRAEAKKKTLTHYLTVKAHERAVAVIQQELPGYHSI